MKLNLVILSLLVLTGCASNSHEIMRGNVVMKVSETKAHVCLGENEVKLNDNIDFFYNDCNQFDNSVEGLGGLCKLVKLGHGKVESIVNSHYSLISTSGDFKFNEGDLVEVKK